MITINKKKIEGIVIKQTDYKENHCKVVLLTNEGLQNFIVRGTKKITSKLSLLVQPITKVQLCVTNDKTLNTVTEGIVLENYTNIKENQTKQLVALSMLETIYCFSNHVTDSNLLYKFFLDSLEFLKTTLYPLDLLNYFDIKLWYLLGVMPSFLKCVKCDGVDASYFSIAEGGNLCVNCRTVDSYDEYVSNLLKITFLLKIDKLNDEFLNLIADYRNVFDKIIKLYYIQYLDFSNFNRSLIEKLL